MKIIRKNKIMKDIHMVFKKNNHNAILLIMLIKIVVIINVKIK